jgi:hypothetical protein
MTDVMLFNELPIGTGRTTATAAGSSPTTGVTPASFTWQFQFPVNYGSSQTISEVGVFLIGDLGIGDGDLLNHAIINPPATWGSGNMLMLSVSIGLSN